MNGATFLIIRRLLFEMLGAQVFTKSSTAAEERGKELSVVHCQLNVCVF